jgi:hypothetical protein
MRGQSWQRIFERVERALVWLGRYPPYIVDADFWPLTLEPDPDHEAAPQGAAPRKDAA